MVGRHSSTGARRPDTVSGTSRSMPPGSAEDSRSNRTTSRARGSPFQSSSVRVPQRRRGARTAGYTATCGASPSTSPVPRRAEGLVDMFPAEAVAYGLVRTGHILQRPAGREAVDAEHGEFAEANLEQGCFHPWPAGRHGPADIVEGHLRVLAGPEAGILARRTG